MGCSRKELVGGETKTFRNYKKKKEMKLAVLNIEQSNQKLKASLQTDAYRNNRFVTG